MKDYVFLFVALAVVVFFPFGGVGPDVPGPAPDGPDMVSVFRVNSDTAAAKRHARSMATILFSLSEMLEFDGKRQPPRITSGVQVDDVRLALREWRMKGWSFAKDYPSMVQVFNSYLTQEVGTSGGALDVAQRGKWVRALKTLGDSCQYAADNL